LEFDGIQVEDNGLYPIYHPATSPSFRGVAFQGGYGGPNYVDDLRILYIPSVIEIDIDIHPGSDDNPVNLKSNGVIPVAILTTDDFDAATVDGSTVLFAGTGPAHKDGHLEDVDGDGDIDWIGHFETQETDIESGDTDATLTGQTVDGRDIEGTDSIRIVGGSGKGKSKKPVVGVEMNSWGAIKESVK